MKIKLSHIFSLLLGLGSTLESSKIYLNGKFYQTKKIKNKIILTPIKASIAKNTVKSSQINKIRLGAPLSKHDIKNAQKLLLLAKSNKILIKTVPNNQ